MATGRIDLFNSNGLNNLFFESVQFISTLPFQVYFIWQERIETKYLTSDAVSSASAETNSEHCSADFSNDSPGIIKTLIPKLHEQHDDFLEEVIWKVFMQILVSLITEPLWRGLWNTQSSFCDGLFEQWILRLDVELCV